MSELDATTSRFDRRASTYQDSALQQFLFGPAQETALQLALELVPQARRILDVGDGTGQLLRRARPCYPTAALVGVDLAAQMVAAAIAVTPTKLAVRYIRACAEHLPFNHDMFDLAFATLSLRHWTNPSAGIAEISRVLTPGGMLVVADVFPDQRHRSSARPRVRHLHAAVPTDLGRLLAAHRLRSSVATVLLGSGCPTSRSSPALRRIGGCRTCSHAGCGSASLDRSSCHSRAGSGSDPPQNPPGMLDSLAFVTVNRTQALVLGFFLVVWVSLLLIVVAAPEVFDQALRLPTDHRVVELAVLAGLSGLIGLLAVGVVRRWRWTFWLILVAFLFGVLRVPAAVLQFTGILATNTPTWYVTFQALLGVVQFGIGLVMVVGYRRSGAWGRSERCRGTRLSAHPPDARRPAGRWHVDQKGSWQKHTLAGSRTMLWCLPGVLVLDTRADTVDDSRLNRIRPDMSPVSPVQDHLLPYLTWQ